MPDTEDKAIIAHVGKAAADAGKRLRTLTRDLWIIFSNNHAEQSFHTMASPFTIHAGGEATAYRAGGAYRTSTASTTRLVDLQLGKERNKGSTPIFTIDGMSKRDQRIAMVPQVGNDRRTHRYQPDIALASACHERRRAGAPARRRSRSDLPMELPTGKFADTIGRWGE